LTKIAIQQGEIAGQIIIEIWIMACYIEYGFHEEVEFEKRLSNSAK